MGNPQDLLKAGDEAPELSARTFDGADISLSALVGQGPVVLVFIRGFS